MVSLRMFHGGSVLIYLHAVYIYLSWALETCCITVFVFGRLPRWWRCGVILFFMHNVLVILCLYLLSLFLDFGLGGQYFFFFFFFFFSGYVKSHNIKNGTRFGCHTSWEFGPPPPPREFFFDPRMLGVC